MDNTRHYVGGCLFVLFSSLVFLYWVCVPLNDTQFTYGYPRLATPPSPNGFKTSRYGWDWWLIWVLTLNGLLPILLAFSLMKSNYKEFSKIHIFLAAIWTFGNLVLFFWLWIRSCFNCNTGYSFYNSACNDPRWCCKYFGATPDAAEWCPNTTPCVPDVTDLAITPQYFQHWLFSMFFALLSLFHVFVNKSLSDNGLFT